MKRVIEWLKREKVQGMGLILGTLTAAALVWGPERLEGKSPLTITILLAKSGWYSLLDYVVAHAIPCLLPAFFIAGAIGVFLSQGSVMKYLGTRTRPWISYTVASFSGTVLAVCSCTVLPIFTGIYKRGAGLGPAVAFLYSGPAINLLAIIYSARLLGVKMGIARGVGATLFSVLIGFIMAFLFKDEERKPPPAPHFQPEGKKWASAALFTLLLLILLAAASHKYSILLVLIFLLALLLARHYSKREVREWLESTWSFVKLIAPWLLVGVFAAGAIKILLPPEVVTQWLGGNGLKANFTASFMGALMYFATLTEVPIIKALTQLGMGEGPALALLLAGPALSLPNILVLRKVMGTRKAMAYITLVVSMATLSGLIYGKLF